MCDCAWVSEKELVNHFKPECVCECVKRERLDGLLSAPVNAACMCVCVCGCLCVTSHSRHLPVHLSTALLQFKIKFQANISLTSLLWASHCHSSLKRNWKGIFNSLLCTYTTLPHYICYRNIYIEYHLSSVCTQKATWAAYTAALSFPIIHLCQHK